MKLVVCKWFFILGAFFLNLSVTIAQSPVVVNSFNRSSVGVPITVKEFNQKVSNYLKRMSNWEQFTAQEYIDMVRAYNTIGGDIPIKNEFYKMYYTVFLVMYNKIAAKKLNAEFTKGMAQYSKEYDIWIGDVPLGNNKSRFKLDTLGGVTDR